MLADNNILQNIFLYFFTTTNYSFETYRFACISTRYITTIGLPLEWDQIYQYSLKLESHTVNPRRYTTYICRFMLTSRGRSLSIQNTTYQTRHLGHISREKKLIHLTEDTNNPEWDTISHWPYEYSNKRFLESRFIMYEERWSTWFHKLRQSVRIHYT